MICSVVIVSQSLSYCLLLCLEIEEHVKLFVSKAHVVFSVMSHLNQVLGSVVKASCSSLSFISDSRNASNS
jgi:hypothetical protein